MNIRPRPEDIGDLQSRSSPNSGPFCKSPFLATGMLVPASVLAGLGVSQGAP
jgi:hypothetical protein